MFSTHTFNVYEEIFYYNSCLIKKENNKESFKHMFNLLI